MLVIETIKDRACVAPTKSYKGDAGWDVYSTESYVLQPGETRRFLLGFRIIGQPGQVYITEDRSSLAMRGLQVVGRVIDNGYRGEVSMILHNSNGAGEILINKGDKIGQILIFETDDGETLWMDGRQVESKPLGFREDKGTGSSGA